MMINVGEPKPSLDAAQPGLDVGLSLVEIADVD
jgi:hypothetical protein